MQYKRKAACVHEDLPVDVHSGVDEIQAKGRLCLWRFQVVDASIDIDQ